MLLEDNCCKHSSGIRLPAQVRMVLTTTSSLMYTGPTNSWTIHWLWPDNCDGSYEANCDAARAYTNITAILQSYGKTDLLAYMNTYWKDSAGDDESFWEHEWAKHGTCINTLDPSCYTGYTPQEEIPDFFQTTVNLFKTLDSYTVCSQTRDVL